MSHKDVTYYVEKHKFHASKELINVNDLDIKDTVL